MHILSSSSLNVESSHVQCCDFLGRLLERDLGVATLLLNVMTLLQPWNLLPSFATIVDVVTSSVECCDFSFQCRDLGHGLLVLSMLLENPSKCICSVNVTILCSPCPDFLGNPLTLSIWFESFLAPLHQLVKTSLGSSWTNWSINIIKRIVLFNYV